MSQRLIHALVDDATGDVPGRPAVTDATGTSTYRELAQWSRGVATLLRQAGVDHGERVVIQLPSTRELVALFHGTVRAGAVFVPLNPAMRPFHLGAVLADAEPALVISDGEHARRLRELTDVPVWELSAIWPQVLDAAGGVDADGRDVVPGPAEDDVAALIYTSGSTAHPKAVVALHRAVVFACHALQAALGYRADDVVFCRFPMSWDYGLYKVLMTCLARCQVVLADEESDLTLLSRMTQVQATVVPIVPSLAAMIVALAPRSAALPPVRMFTNTGAALPESTAAELRRLFPGARVVRQYGQTECKRACVMPPSEELSRPGSVGLPLPGTEVRLLGPDGVEVGFDEVGEITVTGPHVMAGYWRAPELTARTFRPDGAGGTRLHTGDYGRRDAYGYLYFEGRRDEIFKRKGIRMSVVEIEAAATDIPGVRAATALPPQGDRDLALVVEADEMSSHEVLRALADRLELAKVPAICRVVPTMPLTHHGKSARDEIAALVGSGCA